MLEAEARKLDVRQRDFLGHRGMMGSESAGAVSNLHWLVWRLVVSEANGRTFASYPTGRGEPQEER